MLTLYHRNRGITVNQLRNVETHTNAAAIYTQNDGTSTEEIEEIATDLGFSTLAATLTGKGIFDLMKKNGPIMYCGAWVGATGGHCVVITGTDGRQVWINDPWYGAVTRTYQKVVGHILAQDTALIYYG